MLPPSTARLWEHNLAPTSGKVPDPTQLPLRSALSQMPLTSPMSHTHLPNPLLRATLCGMDIVVARASKTPRLLPAVHANILGRLWFVWFWLGKCVWGQIYGRKLSSKPRTPKAWWKQCRTRRQCVGKMLARRRTAHCLPPVRRQDMWVHSWSVIGVNKIADVGIDFGLNHGL